MSNFRMSRHGGGERGRRSGTKNVGSGEISHQEKKRALPGMWRLKSTKPCTRKPVQPTRPERWRAAEKDLSCKSTRRRERKNKAPRNQAQHAAPAIPVSARASR